MRQRANERELKPPLAAKIGWNEGAKARVVERSEKSERLF
jgi:hypothetical protein